MPLLQDKLPTLKHRDLVLKGEALFLIDQVPVYSPLTGTLRGLISEKVTCYQGLKCADVDPRPVEKVDCLTISDKARALGERF